MARSLNNDDVVFLQRKVPGLYFVVVCFVLIVILRLFYLQIFRGGTYKTLSQQISVREEEVVAKRGAILDRNRRVLADSRSYFEIVAIPQFVAEREKMTASLARLIHVSGEEIEKKLASASGDPPFMPVALVEDADYDRIARVKEFERPDYPEGIDIDLSGVEVRASPLRVYLYPELFSHVLGYVKEIDKTGLEKMSEKHPGRYSRGDLLGASGIERFYDLELKGTDGMRARVVDARGREIRGNPDLEILEHVASFPPVDGNHIVTTLDYDAQKAAADSFGQRRGAVTALDPSNGEVLVLYSSPGFDGNRIMKKIDKAYWRTINISGDKYLYNRAIQGTYPPGSTYKIIGAVASLDSKKVDLSTRFNCGGGLKFGNRYFKCWNSSGHGSVDIVRGLTQSCDVFFYNAGLKMGVDGLHHYAGELGLGKKTGIDIPFEEPGLIPDSEWKQKRFNEPWIESETLSVSIGQGYDLVTPLQNAVVIAMIANGGRPLRPHLLKAVIDQQKKTLRENTAVPNAPVVPEDVLKPIRQGLIGVVHGEGTARGLGASPYKIAGKTGTAQVIGNDSRARRGERTRDHALFVAYAPYDDPKIAVSVVVENGGHGGGAAAPVAMAVIDAYLKKIIPVKDKK